MPRHARTSPCSALSEAAQREYAANGLRTKHLLRSLLSKACDARGCTHRARCRCAARQSCHRDLVGWLRSGHRHEARPPIPPSDWPPLRTVKGRGHQPVACLRIGPKGEEMAGVYEHRPVDGVLKLRMRTPSCRRRPVAGSAAKGLCSTSSPCRRLRLLRRCRCRRKSRSCWWFRRSCRSVAR